VIRSRLGDIDFSAPPTVTADTLRQSFDLVPSRLQGLRPGRCNDLFCAAGRTEIGQQLRRGRPGLSARSGAVDGNS